jgi:pyridoxine/pyridoxamine 5'-phosphate oxidase
MTDIFFEELKAHLFKGIHKKGHPFRYGVFASIGLQGEPALRTVVLRHVSDDLTLRFYTDGRSNKIEQIKNNNRVSLLFYHPKQLLQVKVEGIATIISKKETLQKYWSGVQPNSRKDYITSLKPGSSISHPDAVEYVAEENYFTILEITPTRIEYLKLKRPNHLRIQFLKTDINWKGTFLVP